MSLCGSLGHLGASPAVRRGGRWPTRQTEARAGAHSYGSDTSLGAGLCAQVAGHVCAPPATSAQAAASPAAHPVPGISLALQGHPG